MATIVKRETKSNGFLASMRIRTRLIILVTVMMIPLVLLGIFGSWGILNSNRTSITIFEDRLIPTHQLTNINDLMRENMLQLHLGTKHDPRLPESQLHAWHPITMHTDLIDENIAEIDRIWVEYMDTYLTTEEAALAQEFQIRRQEFVERGIRRTAENLINGDYASANTMTATDLPRLYNSAKEGIDALIDLQQRVAIEEMENNETAFRVIIGLTIGATIISILVSILLSTLIVGSITGPLSQVVARVRDIAEGEGDLRQRVEYNAKDELGELTGWINRFIDQVHTIVQSIQGNYIGVKESSDVLNESSQSMSAGVEEMSKQSEMIASSATQMNQNLQVVSSAVEEMSISIGEVAKKAADAASVVGKASQGAQNTNKVVSTLGNEAAEIGKVIESIRAIAEQTNLLALNAAIEAASAGNAGKGFAVVASEVKELAREAGNSSEDIKNRIEAIQKSVENTVRSIDEITKIITQVNEYSASIASAVEEQSITSREIASNVEQTNVASNDVTKNISGISQALGEGAKNATDTSAQARKLKGLADELGSLVNRFKV